MHKRSKRDRRSRSSSIITPMAAILPQYDSESEGKLWSKLALFTRKSTVKIRASLKPALGLPVLQITGGTVTEYSKAYIGMPRAILVTYAHILVHGQVTIIFVVSVCLFVCAEFFSAIFDPIWIKLGHMLHVRV